MDPPGAPLGRTLDNSASTIRVTPKHGVVQGEGHEALAERGVSASQV